MEIAARVRRCDSCGREVQERDVFSFKDKVLCRDCYLGEDELGPLRDQYVKCPHCGTTLHKFTVVCYNCNKPIREVGKIQTESSHMGLRALLYFIGVLVAIVVPVALGPMSVDQGGSVARAVTLGILGPVVFLVGLFRALFPSLFLRNRWLGSFVAGFLAWLLAGVGLALMVLLAFP